MIQATNRTHVIWWLGQAETEFIAQPEVIQCLPLDIQTLVLDRNGRPGRGRLWMAKDIQASVEHWPANYLGNYLAIGHGGLVVSRDAVGILASLPGIVTDIDLNRIH